MSDRDPREYAKRIVEDFENAYRRVVSSGVDLFQGRLWVDKPRSGHETVFYAVDSGDVVSEEPKITAYAVRSPAAQGNRLWEYDGHTGVLRSDQNKTNSLSAALLVFASQGESMEVASIRSFPRAVSRRLDLLVKELAPESAE